MSQPDFDVSSFLAERGRPASVSTVTERGRPALALMWYALEEGRLWFHTPMAAGRPSPFLRTAAQSGSVATMMATFDPPDDVRQFRATGPARIDRADHERVRRIYDRYLGTWTPGWEEQATSAEYQLWSMLPESGMVVSFPDLAGGVAFRWSTVPSFLQGQGAPG